MELKEEMFLREKLTLEHRTIEYRAARNIIYVNNPLDPAYQNVNLFVPEAYYHDASVNGYTRNTAPVFMPNEVGGYMAGKAGEPGYSRFCPGKINTIFEALEHGYVVAAPAIRGRELKNEEGIYTGKAPACIVDYKAAVRFLRYYRDIMPGDVDKIITNGTSAGGALSSLMGATGNHKDYETYLQKIGAAETDDHVFAASCYCPITNLEHADMAYEWQFLDETNENSKELAMKFSDYVNSLDLRDEQGKQLILDHNGDGSFKEKVKSALLASVQRAVDGRVDVSDQTWLAMDGQQAVGMDFSEYAKTITRMKATPAFDDFLLQTPENDLFGTEEGNARHFTEYGLKKSADERADKSADKNGCAGRDIIKMMNPMEYIDREDVDVCRYWRIRHGECDRDTSAAISAILAFRLKQLGYHVDYALPWGIPHSGDYDLEELFAWIDQICKNEES